MIIASDYVFIFLPVHVQPQCAAVCFPRPNNGSMRLTFSFETLSQVESSTNVHRIAICSAYCMMTKSC